MNMTRLGVSAAGCNMLAGVVQQALGWTYISASLVAIGFGCAMAMLGWE